MHPNSDRVSLHWFYSNFSPSENPKGVMISYRKMLHNFKLMEESYGTDSSTIELCLLPHYNGFALVGSYLHTLFAGATAYFIKPEAFFHHQNIWVEAMHELKVTHAKVPGSAFFDSIHTQPGSYGSKNLDSVCCIACIENVHIQDLRNFEDFMSEFGLRKKTISIGYGLAEHVALVSSARYDSEREVVEFRRLSCGRPSPGVTVKIVNPVGGGLGEVWISSESKALGYFQDEVNTKEVFEARIPSDSNLYVCTGDVGFVQDGELFICEKLEDLLALEDEVFPEKDRIFFPTDMENIVEDCVPAIRRGTAIVTKHHAFWCTDKISVLAELISEDYTTEECDLFATQIIRTIVESFNVVTSSVYFFRPFTMSLTTLGKRQHSKSLLHRLRGMEDVKMYEWQHIEKEPEEEPEDLKKGKPPRRFEPATVKNFAPTSQGTLMPGSHGGGPLQEHAQRFPLSPVQEERFTLDTAPDRFTPASPKRMLQVPEQSHSVPPAQATPEMRSVPQPLATSPQGKSFRSPKEKQAKRWKRPPLRDDGRFDLAPGMHPPGTPGIQARRVSLPASPWKTHTKSVKRIQSESTLVGGASGMNKMLNIIQKVTGRKEIGPNEKIWDAGSPVVADEMSKIMQQEYGFTIDKATLLMAESPTALMKLMKMSLLNTDKLYRLTSKVKSKGKEYMPIGECLPHYNFFMGKVLRSESRVFVNEVEEFQHSEDDIAIIGMGGFFAGQFVLGT